jgi:hypothetical protein
VEKNDLLLLFRIRVKTDLPFFMEEPPLLCVENRRVHTQSAQLAGLKLFSTEP